jgi:hypothetical protein
MVRSFAFAMGLVCPLLCMACGGEGADEADGAVGDDEADAGASADAGGADTGGDEPASPSTGADVLPIGKTFEGGQFHLGPVDWEESQWHNACAPLTKYRAEVRKAEGTLLAGLWQGIPNVSSYCDACIQVSSAKGKSALLRVVTYGETTSNSIDVSPDALKLLDSGEFPRTMSWSLAKCPDTGKIFYEFQTGSNEWWTSLWVRNARLPVAKVEVKSKNHTSFVALERAGDGTLTDASGFGQGEFTLRLTSNDGKEYTETFAWPTGGVTGTFLTGKGNFP